MTTRLSLFSTQPKALLVFIFLINNQMMFLNDEDSIIETSFSSSQSSTPLVNRGIFQLDKCGWWSTFHLYAHVGKFYEGTHIIFHFKDPTLHYAQGWEMINLNMNCTPSWIIDQATHFLAPLPYKNLWTIL